MFRPTSSPILRRTVAIKPVSDGDPTHRPSSTGTHRLVDPPTIYLEKLGTQWMEHRGETQPGITYCLDKLPYGYALYQRPRPGNPKNFDKWLYGHPTHKWFDSPNRFFPHFLHLMNNDGDNTGCPCALCTGNTPKTKAARSRKTDQNISDMPKTGKVGRPKKPDLKVDDEGNPDVYRHLIDKLQKEGTLDELIQETMSMDWRAERSLLPKFLEHISQQPLWVPRIAELVLFVRTLGATEELCFDDGSKQYKIYDSEKGEFTGLPCWEAGVIGQVANEELRLEDLVFETDKEYHVINSGFRVENLPDPNGDDKSMSKQYKYVALHHIRPFVLWHEFLRFIEQKLWHPTIKHALMVMSSFSLVEKYRFRGSWPNAEVLCKGIYIGSEFITIGDVVRLIPTNDKHSVTVTDVMQVHSIKLKFSHLDTASDDDNDDGHPYNTSAHITGTAYTTDMVRAFDFERGHAVVSPEDLPVGLEGYGEWYRLHDPSKSLQIPFSRVMGRCYEAEASMLWLPPQKAADDDFLPDLSAGLTGLQRARAYSTKHDRRIQDGNRWFWGDCRTDALDLETLNGREVGRYDTSRNPQKWRKQIKVIEGFDGVHDKPARASDRPLRGYNLNSSLVRSALQAAGSERAESVSAGEGSSTRKRRLEAESEAESSGGEEGDQDSDAELDRFVDELADGFDVPEESNAYQATSISGSLPKRPRVQVFVEV